MDSIAWVTIAIMLIVAVVGWRVVKRIEARTAESKWLPEELRAAKLKFAEQTFRIWRPIALIARVDRGYTLGAEIRLAEFKTRANKRAYRSDVIELSAQRMAIEESTGERVGEVGYVLIQDTTRKNRAVQRVRLMKKTELMAIARRREAILSGKVVPMYAQSRGLCKKCGFRKECRPDLRGDE